MQREVHQIAKHTGLTLKLQLLSGYATHAVAMLESVQALKPEPDDVIFFYYLGHGYRTKEKKSIWPNLLLTHDDRSTDLQIIIETIIAAKPRMAFILADCCNNVMNERDFLFAKSGEIFALGPKPDLGKGYRQLFNDFSGIVVAVGARKGDFAYCDTQGHFYTEAILQSMHEEVQSPHPQWATLLSKAASKVDRYQTPYYEILLVP
jgi:hypothetical protein